MNIRLVRQEEIDKQRYNSCIHFATNGSLFGYDWYLNATAREWDVLVEGEEWVSAMPLPREKNWLGRQQLVHPRLVPELAVYSVKPLSPKRIQAFWDAIPPEIRGGSLMVEPASVPTDSGRFQVKTATGSALFLDRPYEEIIGDFPPAYHEGLLRAEDADLKPAPSFKPETLADFWLRVNGNSSDNDWRFHAMQRLMYQVLHRGWGGSQAIVNTKGDLLAMTFLAYSHGRVLPLFTTESPEGNSKGALTLLWDNLLRGHEGKKLKVRREDIL